MEQNKSLDIMIVGGNYIGKGAEAMLLVTRDMLLKFFPNAHFWVNPINGDEANKFLNDGFNIVYLKKTNRFFELFQLLMAKFGFKKREKKHYKSGDRIQNIFDATDMVIDISGFSSSDQIGAKAAICRFLFYLWASYAGNIIVFMPQSWGPFQNKCVRFFTRQMLKKASLIWAREKLSYDYLKNSKCVPESKIEYSPDIAFLFKVNNSETIGRKLVRKLNFCNSDLPLVSITPNMRIYERTPGKNSDNNYIQILMAFIKYILNETNCNIILIPHEASCGRQNDTELCELLKGLINNPERVATIAGYKSALEVKAVIGISEFLLASRYHSLVASLSMQTPVAVVGWSHKYNELLQLVGLDDFIIDPVRDKTNDDSMEKIFNAFKRKNEIARILEEKIPQIEDEIITVFEKSAVVINKYV